MTKGAGRGVLAAIALLCLTITTPTLAETRVALLIGNGAYVNSPKLANPVNDIALVGQTLKAAGFEDVTVVADQTLDQMRAALKGFEAKAANADVALVFYSGHGLEIGGQNFLVPVDAKLAAERDVKFEALSLGDVMEAMAPARKLKLVLLDACRDNPFVAAMKRSSATRGSLTRGLGRIEEPSSATLIAFAAAPGQVAQDGDGANSPFSTALAKNLTAPGLDVRLALGGVHDDVMAATKGAQEPYVTGSLGRDPVLLGPSGGAKPPQVLPQPQVPPQPPVAVAPPPPLNPPPTVPQRAPGFIFPDSDRVALTPADLAGLSAVQLRLARNEIFARHGRRFESADLAQYFSQFAWYRPIAAEVRLSALEQANVDLIQRAEQGGIASNGGGSGGYIIPDSDRRLLTPADLARFDKATLRLARNEIAARRGRFFQDAQLAAYFGRQPWYRPTSWDPPMSEIETRNMALIQSMEQSR